MSPSTIITDIGDGVATFTLNRPQRRNAFNDELYDGLREALATVQRDDTVRVAVVTGAPGAFSAGQDISEMGQARAFAPFVDQLAAFDKPLIAAVNGVAVGIGFTMLLHCDIVYVAEGARLRAPFVSLGLVPEAGSSLLLGLIVGPQRAAEILYTDEWIEARGAVALGLAAGAVAGNALMKTALSRARQIAVQPLPALRKTKQLLLAARAEALQAARRREDADMAVQLGSPENLAAIQAFRRRKT